jgi:hypothetical protein
MSPYRWMEKSIVIETDSQDAHTKRMNERMKERKI